MPDDRPRLVLHSSEGVGTRHNGVDEVEWRGSSLDPPSGVAVALGGGKFGGLDDFARLDEGLPGQGMPAEAAPPCLLRVQPPAGSLGDGHLLKARMGGQPGRVTRLWWLEGLSVITVIVAASESFHQPRRGTVAGETI